MEAFRYWLAVFLAGIVPAMLAYLLMLHGLLGIWRRIGLAAAQVCLWMAVLGVFLASAASARGFAAADFGPNPIVFNAGLVCLAMAVWFRVLVARSMGWRAMAGFPEIAPAKYPQGLVSGGVYARVRHPRYLQALLALAGWALLANRPVAYLACALWIPGMWVVAVLEERELRARFGGEFENYCRRVPRFIPRRHAAEARA